MEIERLKMNITYPYHQYLKVKDGIELTFKFPVMSTNYRSFHQVLEDKDNEKAWHQFIELVAGLQVVFNNKQ